MIFSFGKHKDKDSADPGVPLSYLMWLEMEDWCRPEWRRDLNAEISKRQNNRPGAGKVVKSGR